MYIYGAGSREWSRRDVVVAWGRHSRMSVVRGLGGRAPLLPAAGVDIFAAVGYSPPQATNFCGVYGNLSTFPLLQ